MNHNDKAEHNPMDSAALAAGAIAAVLSITSSEGKYNLFSIVPGIVITLVLIAYEYPVRRTSIQNIAFGSVLSLSILPVVGFILELLWPDKNKNDSDVPEEILTGIWVILSGFFYWIAQKGSNKISMAKSTELQDK